jgi:hypothetical protein
MGELERMDRRTAIKWMVAASASVSVLRTSTLTAGAAATGYGTDPKLLEVYKSGDFWPLTLTEAQRKTVTALCDAIIPADDVSPSASQLRVPDFIDEWISAPYPQQKADRQQILEGLKWLESETRKRFRNSFAELDEKQRRAICDDICYLPNAKMEFKAAASFFARFRDLTAGGFYTTQEGMNDIKYVGNVALERFDGPPPEVIKYLKLDQP